MRKYAFIIMHVMLQNQAIMHIIGKGLIINEEAVHLSQEILCQASHLYDMQPFCHIFGSFPFSGQAYPAFPFPAIPFLFIHLLMCFIRFIGLDHLSSL